ncbi:uncharacterized protein LOC108904283 [Anoplophora glabripennis]|uniref:uncharacterized protein LOC108904283 n=1 Tax=Anoplophora glabripennis TaxID=217634 RepID=UPI000874DA92|nr:uncharacterized protein LOC108904283 [Anoplophora glabripennis]XP_018562285.1 uncharacterized protein LOC108904283 [Anoplophora glabripennis]
MTTLCKFLKKSYRNSQIKHFYTSMVESGLARIEIEENCNPFHLFGEWLDESKACGKFNTVFFNLATTNRNGDVSNRVVVLRDFKENSLVFVTNGNSKKIQQIKANPKVSACFFWNYTKDEKYIQRQVRIEGISVEMSFQECLEYYNKEPLYCKIRSHICQQGQKVDWDTLKKKHDEILEEIKTTNKQLPMPEYLVAYKIIPNKFDFYFAWDNNIADRLEFIQKSGNGWEFYHVAA